MDARGEYLVQLLIALILLIHGYSSLISSLKNKATSFHSRSSLLSKETSSEISTFIESRIQISDSLQNLGSGPVQQLVHDTAQASFEEYAKTHPSLPALELNSCATSYAALNTESTHIAHYIIECGISRGEYVAIISKVTHDMIAAMFAVLKAGAAFIPIDSSLPTSRIAYMLQSGKCRLVLVEKGFKLDGFDNLCEIPMARSANLFSTPKISAKDPAYVVFTSGSTGKPKGNVAPNQGVAIAHESLNSFINATPNILHTSIGKRVAQVASASFDMCLAEIFCTLAKGATLVLKDPADPFKHIANVDTVLATPTLLSKLDPALHPNLKTIVSGGEALTRSTAQRWRHALLVNGYGPTEITMACARGIVNPDDPIITIGTAYPNSRLYIVNENLELVEQGCPGELVVGGIGVALGYVDRPDLTAQRFLEDPFARDGSRIYKTGDICKWTEDGRLQFMGRNDDMLEEVAAGIERCKSVTGAAVVAHESNLIAFVTPGNLDVDALRTEISKVLPHYMSPAAVLAVDEFPQTSNQKVFKLLIQTDKNALVQIYINNPLEKDKCTTSKIKSIWASVLGCSESIITLDTSFFDIGGDSMSSVIVLSMIEPLIPKGISINKLYRYQTLGALAAYIDGKAAECSKINWRQEYSIINNWTLDIAQLEPAMKDGAVVLTGATGFLGTHILAHLLSLNSPPNIFCVAVRANDETTAIQRVRSKLREYHLYSPKLAHSFRKYVQVIQGDLCSPRLGMKESEFLTLCKCSKYVIHTAAALSHLHSYSNLKPANVLSLEWIVKLACSKTLKQIHFVSTIGVCELVPLDSDFFGKELILDFVDPSPTGPGYIASKWCGEMASLILIQILKLAGQLGVPISIYRPSYITAHSIHGICNPIGSIDLIMRSIVDTRVFPALDAEFVDLVPVDFCAASVVTAAFARDDSSGVKVYHSNNPNFVSWREIFELLKKTLPDLSLTSVEEYLKVLAGVEGSDVVKALFEADSESFFKPFGCERMRSAIGFVCPPVSHDLLEVYTAASWE